MKYYKISEENLINLLVIAHKFSALEEGGVDNWLWLSDSYCDYIDRWKKENNISKFANIDFADIAEKELKDFKAL